jgi:hypothetical protein
MLLGCLAAFVAVGTATAQEHGEGTVSETAERASDVEDHGETAEHHGHSFHPNDLGVFLGATDEQGHDLQFTYGLDYERRFSEHLGIGGLIDYAGGGLRNTVLAVPVFWHPGGGWKLIAAPGVEFHNGRGGGGEHATGDGGHGEADDDETHFLFRIGAGYHVHVSDHWGVVPTVDLDFVDGEEVWVYGVGLAYGW